MNQIQLLGIIRKNKVNICVDNSIQVPMLEIDYLTEQGNDNYQIKRMRIILDNPELNSWIYAKKGSLIYVIGKAITIKEEVVVSASSILLIRDHTGKSGVTLLFQYGTRINQAILAGEFQTPNALITDTVRIRGSLEQYNEIPILKRNEGKITTPSYLVYGKPSVEGIVV